MLTSLLQILQIGVHGFAFVMLYLSYRLIRELVGQRHEKPVGSDDPAPRAIFAFLVMSCLFFVVGVVTDVYYWNYRTISTNVYTSPKQMPGGLREPPHLELNATEMALGGRSAIEFRPGDGLSIVLDPLTNRIRDQDDLLRSFVRERGLNTEAGFSDDDE